MVRQSRLLPVIALAAISLGWSSTARPQDAATAPKARTFARIVVIKPKADQTTAFEAGYKRHLDWHRAQQDTWTWYGWRFVLGERLGLFMDGTFDHAVADFDAAVKPADDAADNATNVLPYADFLSHGVFESVDRIGRGAPLPDDSPFLALSTYRVAPGQEAAFESALVSALATSSVKRVTCYRLRIGGSVPQYLLMRSASSFATAAALPDLSIPPVLLEQAQSELLRYQPALSYRP